MTPTGLYPMLYACFDEAGAVRRDAITTQVNAAVAANADGVAILGLGTEGNRLSAAEKHQLVDWTLEALSGRLPLAVTVGGPTAQAQTGFARAVRAQGAAWLILQPPPEPVGEPELIAFFGATADAMDCPVAVQNAPQFLGYGLTLDGLAELNRAHPNASVVKAECSAVDVARLTERLEGRMAVFNGRAGLELTDNYRAGCVGMIPGIETIDLQAASVRALLAGDEDEAEALYGRVLPALAFIMQGVDHFVTYGKQLAARRLGLTLAPQARSGPPPHPFGLAAVARFARQLGPLPVAP